MADLRMKVIYTIDVTANEFRIICSALLGTLDEKFKEEATALQDRLFRSRNAQAQQMLSNILANAQNEE